MTSIFTLTFGTDSFKSYAEELKLVNNVSHVEPRSIECRGNASISSVFNSNIRITVNGTWIYRTDGSWNYRESHSISGASSTMSYEKSVVTRYDSAFSYTIFEKYNGAVVNYYDIYVPMACNG